MKDRIDELNNEILDGTSSLNVDGLEFSSMEFKLFLTLTLLSWKVSDFFEIDPKDLQFTPNSFEFINFTSPILPNFLICLLLSLKIFLIFLSLENLSNLML